MAAPKFRCSLSVRFHGSLSVPFRCNRRDLLVPSPSAVRRDGAGQLVGQLNVPNAFMGIRQAGPNAQGDGGHGCALLGLVATAQGQAGSAAAMES